MLTRDDQTVEDALDVLDAIRPLGLRHIGFKDVGVRPEVLQELNRGIKAQGAISYLEVVGTTPEACLRSVRIALEIGVDRLLGGTDVDAALRDPRGQRDRVLPVPRLSLRPPDRCSAAEPEDVAAHCRRFVAKGCAGVDLLAYRATDAEPLDLVRAARRALGDRTLIVAGSVDQPARIGALAERRRRCLHDRLRGVQRRLLAAQGRSPLAAARRAGRLRPRQHDRRRRHRHPEPQGGGDRRRAEAAWARRRAPIARRFPGRAGRSRIRGCGRRRWRRPSAARSRPPGRRRARCGRLASAASSTAASRVDRDGQPLGPCIIWMDRRAEAEVAGLPAERVQDATGVDPGRHAHGRQGPLAEAPRARARGDPTASINRSPTSWPGSPAPMCSTTASPRPPWPMRSSSAASIPGCSSCSSSTPGSCRRSPRPPSVRERCTGRAPRSPACRKARRSRSAPATTSPTRSARAWSSPAGSPARSARPRSWARCTTVRRSTGAAWSRPTATPAGASSSRTPAGSPAARSPGSSRPFACATRASWTRWRRPRRPEPGASPSCRP